MKPRDRVMACIDYTEPNLVPVHASVEAGLYEHGQKLLDLWRRYPQDSGAISNTSIPAPDPNDVMADGSYLRRWTVSFCSMSPGSSARAP